MTQLWTEHYKVASYLVNLRGRAGLYAILNFIQDVGWMHAIHLGIQLSKNQTWVFTRQKLIMSEWPRWNEEVTIQTWLRPPQDDPFFYRDYELFLGEKKIGECTSTFTVMDVETRKLAKVDWSPWAQVWRTAPTLEHKPVKIVPEKDIQELTQFEVRNSDLDMNNHVNNTRYAQWILDSLPLDILRGQAQLQEYEVNFLAETKSGDVVSVQKTRTDKTDGELTTTQFQGVRTSDSKPVFTATMKVSRLV